MLVVVMDILTLWKIPFPLSTIKFGYVCTMYYCTPFVQSGPVVFIFSTELNSYFCLQWTYLPDPITRDKMSMPPRSQVDYRAACFCHRQLIDRGYVCSVCLSS